MRDVFQILPVVFLVGGTPSALLGASALLYAHWAPIRPPPSLNEGPGLAEVLGVVMTIAGSVSVLLGVSMLAGLRALPKPEARLKWIREHKRLW